MARYVFVDDEVGFGQILEKPLICANSRNRVHFQSDPLLAIPKNRVSHSGCSPLETIAIFPMTER